MNYSDKLKDPRWQKKRLEILNRDGFRCLACGDTKNTLHVHHCYYVSKREPWEYPNESLLTFCAKCHKDVDEDRESEAHALSMAFEMSACVEMERHILNLASGGSGPDEGVAWAIRETARRMSIPLSEAMNVFYSLGVRCAFTDDAIRSRLPGRPEV